MSAVVVVVAAPCNTHTVSIKRVDLLSRTEQQQSVMCCKTWVVHNGDDV